jgi:hypothetical protein
VEELGYVPYRLLARTSPFDIEFLPARESLHIDPQDPRRRSAAYRPSSISRPVRRQRQPEFRKPFHPR